MKIEENQVVYDINGYSYLYKKETKEGHVVSEIFSGKLSSGKIEQVEGKLVLLDKVYVERPTRERLEEVEELEDKKRALELDILTREAELQRLKSIPNEDILKEKLHKIKGAEFLIKALTKNFKMYSYSTKNASIYTLSYGAVGVDLATQEVYLLRQDTPGGETYSRERLLQPPTFATEEEAEEALLKEVIKGNVEVYSYQRALEIDKLFDKLGYTRTKTWKDDLLKSKRNRIKGVEEEIELAEQGIARYSRTKREAEEKLKKLLKEDK